MHSRDEDTKRPLPRRLQELVAQYPYTTSPDPTADGLLTRPRFSTRRHDALFVRVEALYADNAQIQSSPSPVGILTDALKSKSGSNSGEYVYLWDQVKAAAASGPDDRSLPAVLSDDTINLLSLVSTDPKEQDLLGTPGPASTLVSPLSPIMETFLSPTPNANGVSVPVRRPTLPSSTPQTPKDWAEFSSAGFGETAISQNFASTLLDKDVEVTEPPVRRKSSRRKQNRNNITSVELSSPTSDLKPASEEPEGPKLTLVATDIVQVDEAFIDFWRDAVADPVSNDWPKFVVGELKHPLTPRSFSTSSEAGEQVSSDSPISWIIIEEKFRKPTPPPTPPISHEALPISSGLRVAPTPPKRTSSPRPSFGEKKNSSLSTTFKRFTLFGSSRDDLPDDTNSVASGSGKKDSLSGKKKKSGIGRSPRIGELGEVFSEEPEPLPEVPENVEKMEESGKAKTKVVAVAAGVVGGAGLATVTEVVVDAPVPETVVDKVTPEGAGPETLPPAPESVVSHGETPGPQLALDSTEAGLHHPPEPVPPVDDTEKTADFSVAPHEPTIEHLEDKVEDSATDAGVDLDPVPIIPNDPVEAAEPAVGSALDGECPLFVTLSVSSSRNLHSQSTVSQPTDAELYPPTEGKATLMGLATRD